jgi:NAD(P)-dependent dehydrogenase (short-subunit alcohol dehydrogenase family)
MKLAGRVAIVTGAGRGLGREAAIAMAREGSLGPISDATTGENGTETCCRK